MGILGIITISLIIYQTRIKSQPSGGKRKKNSFKIYRSLLSIFILVGVIRQRIWGGFLYKITCSNPSYEHLYEKMKRVHGITKAATFTNKSGGSSSKNEGSGNSKNSRNIISVEAQS